MKKLNYRVLNLDAILVALPKGTGMRQEVPSAIAAMFPQNTDLCPLKVNGKSTWAFGYIKHRTTRLTKGLIYLLTKSVQGMLNGKLFWTALADGVYLAKFLGARVLLFQNLEHLPAVLHMTCPECGQTAWYEDDQSEEAPQFVCACCGAEAFAEQMGVFVGAPVSSQSPELDHKYHDLWARLGVTFRLNGAELENILRNGSGEATTEIFRRALAEGRFFANGDSYVPESMAVIAGEKIGLEAPYESIDFDL